MGEPDTPEEAREYLSKHRSPTEQRAWMNHLLGNADLLAPTATEVIFFGQNDVKNQIAPFLGRSEAFPNMLVLGEPGIGKTQFAKWVASQRKEVFDELLCPVKPEDIPDYGIILLDEAHLQRHPEWLWPTMESHLVTVLGATTRPELLEPAFKSRFFLTIHLRKADEDALVELCEYLLPGVSKESAKVYAGASAGNPRQMERICATAEQVGVNDPALVLATCRLTVDGMTEYQITMLEALERAARPLGLGSLAVLMYTDEQSIREAERLPVEEGLIQLRSNGRTLTKRGKRYLEQVNAP